MMANERARALRRDMTDSEWRIWSELRKRQIGGHRFRRQHPIGNFILDFVCLDRRLVVEVDGGHHSEPEQLVRDRARDHWLASQGYKVVRVDNQEVFDNLDGVLQTIWAELEARTPRPRKRPPPGRARMS